ncbi:Phosphotyrosyl phosphatase activator [Atractiella rhizophila]|nr:Phosphotyrosyl phosphatase activator [Atractiella rhizophila]
MSDREAPEIPTKRILTPEHLKYFLGSNSYRQLEGFLKELNDAVQGVSLKQSEDEKKEGVTSATVNAVLDILDNIRALAESIPPIPNLKSRFGNPAFRDFHAALVAKSPSLHASLPNFPSEYEPELARYLTTSFGNEERIDYGSGMEINFLLWLYGLRHLGLLSNSKEESSHLVNLVFQHYLELMRYLQKTYWLEPAGSQGAFGLDDYQVLPFLFGSSQLIGHKYISPKSVRDSDLVNEYGNQYMYLGCIAFINSIKTGATLRWHSPLLDDLTAVRNWTKLNAGMQKLHNEQVLGKLPVAQHFFFGSIWKWDGPEELDLRAEEEEQSGHAHHHHEAEGLGDCCGIRVPAAFAEREKIEVQGVGVPGGKIRRVPFD